MNQKKVVLITLILILLVSGGIFLFILNRGAGEVEDGMEKNRGFLGIFPSRDSGETVADRNGFSTSTEEGVSGGERGVPDSERPVPDFRQISFKPVSGYGIISSNGSTTVRFLETETGHIFEANTKNLEVKRLSNTTIPKIREVLWLEDGSSLAMRYLDDEGRIQSFVTRLEKEEGEEFLSIESEVLAEDITSMDAFGDFFFGIVERIEGSDWALFDSEGNRDNLVASPLSEWLVDVFSEETVALQNKTSSGISGNLYFLDLNQTTLREILSNVPGLSSLVSPSGDFVLFSSVESGNLETSILSVEDGISTPLEIRTLAEKCVWGIEERFLYCAVPKSLFDNLPDSWYGGEVLFIDTFWKINLNSGNSEEFFNPASENAVVDAVQIQTSPEDDFIFFVNKRDGSLWSLRI